MLEEREQRLEVSGKENPFLLDELGEGGRIAGHVPRATQAGLRLFSRFASESVGAAEQAEPNKKPNRITLKTSIFII